MKKIIKQLFIFYLVVVLLKILLSSLIPSPSAYSDEYIYIKEIEEGIDLYIKLLTEIL